METKLFERKRKSCRGVSFWPRREIPPAPAGLQTFLPDFTAGPRPSSLRRDSESDSLATADHHRDGRGSRSSLHVWMLAGSGLTFSENAAKLPIYCKL